MFSVYGKAGRLFRGSMEELRKIGPTSALGGIRRLGAVGREAFDLAAADAAALASTPRPTPDRQHRSAMAAYAQAASPGSPRHPLSRVRDIMNPGAITLLDTGNVGEAWALLAQHRLGQAPVVNAAGMLVGLITRAELMRPDRLPSPHAHALAWQALLMQSVADAMWTPVPSVAPETDIRRLARVLLDTGLPGLPVVDEPGAVIGFVSRTDILRAVVADPPLDLWS